MRPWYKIVELRKEVREGRSFSPDEFAIALEQVVAGTAPRDYRDPEQFFSRTCFTRALTEHSGMVLRRLSGRTETTHMHRHGDLPRPVVCKSRGHIRLWLRSDVLSWKTRRHTRAGD